MISNLLPPDHLYLIRDQVRHAHLSLTSRLRLAVEFGPQHLTCIHATHIKDTLIESNLGHLNIHTLVYTIIIDEGVNGNNE